MILQAIRAKSVTKTYLLGGLLISMLNFLVVLRKCIFLPAAAGLQTLHLAFFFLILLIFSCQRVKGGK